LSGNFAVIAIAVEQSSFHRVQEEFCQQQFGFPVWQPEFD
jgi:hypothetical protein